MTTTVTVSAHCDPKTTQVEVTVEYGVDGSEQKILQDGESEDFYAYDDRVITVKEIPKSA